MFNVTPAGLAALVITKDQEMSNRILAMAGASHPGPTAMFNVLSLKRQTDLIDDLQTKVKVLSAPKTTPTDGATTPAGTPAQGSTGTPSQPQAAVADTRGTAPHPVEVDRLMGAMVAQIMALQNENSKLKQSIIENGGKAYDLAQRRVVPQDLPNKSSSTTIHEAYVEAHKGVIGKLLSDLKALFIQEFSLDYSAAPVPAPPPAPVPAPPTP